MRRHILLSTSSLTILLKCLWGAHRISDPHAGSDTYKRRTTGSGILGISHMTSFRRDSRVVTDPLNPGTSDLNVILVHVPSLGSGGGLELVISVHACQHNALSPISKPMLVLTPQLRPKKGFRLSKSEGASVSLYSDYRYYQVLAHPRSSCKRTRYFDSVLLTGSGRHSGHLGNMPRVRPCRRDLV